MIGAEKNGPPGKYERWLSSASSGSVGLALITDRTFQVQVQAWKVSEASVKISVCLAFSEVQVFRCIFWRTRALRNWSNMFATWLIGFGVLQFLVSERFFPYEPEESN
ncbi:hypothetical protein PIB30_053308 [Stylosanthes scabra]|uniref:Uncharacterized protein n=1 Tax=Stylosanthes scabra TaxID=79078 RepID=A0ABU6YHA6_9FABA|nr:hypothetical protein [Stylosanthes scabra]